MVPIDLVYTIPAADPTEDVIQKMIEGARRMIKVNSNSQQEPEITINPAMKRHFESNRETLQNAPRDLTVVVIK